MYVCMYVWQNNLEENGAVYESKATIVVVVYVIQLEFFGALSLFV